jgi:hypothetical protein
MCQIKHTRPGPGTNPQIAQGTVKISVHIIPLGTPVRQIRHTEFLLRLQVPGQGQVCFNWKTVCLIIASEGLQCGVYPMH